MKKRNNSIALFMVFVLLLSLFAITMVACAPQKPDVPDVPDTPGDTPSNPGDKPGEPNPKPDNPNDELIDFALDGNSVYSADGLGANASNLRFRISSATKNTIPVVGKKDSATILLLAMEGYNAKDIHTVGRYSIFVQDGKLVVNATDTKAMQFAVARLGEMMNADGFKLAKDFNESCMFDNYKSTSGKLVHLTDEDIALLDVAEGIYANGERIKGFTPYVSELNTTSTKLDGYPTITAAATSNKASVSIIQPKDNGGVGIVTVSNSILYENNCF